MIVWAGCLTCRHDKRAKKWEGMWVDESVYPTLTVYDVHQPGHLPDIDDHVIKAFTLTDFGVPLEWSEEELAHATDLANYLEGIHMLEPVAVWAATLHQSIVDVDFHEFAQRYVGHWYGKPSRAARKRYVFLSAGPGAWFMFRRQVEQPQSEAVRRAVQV